jgi:hypothetical protein
MSFEVFVQNSPYPFFLIWELSILYEFEVFVEVLEYGRAVVVLKGIGINAGKVKSGCSYLLPPHR